MLLNYLKLSLRLMMRNPFFTFINVVGLSIGFTTFYILWPYAQLELKSDQFHHDHERIARLSWHHRWTDNGQDWNEFYGAGNFCGVAKQIADEFSEVTDLVRVVHQRTFLKKIQGADANLFYAVYQSNSTKEFHYEENTIYADPNFFQFFSFPLQSGDAASVLSEPGSVVLSQALGIKYFGKADPVNSIIYLNDSIPLKVTGIFKELPRNTHFRFDLVISTAGIDAIDLRLNGNIHAQPKVWMGNNYIKVREGVQLVDLERKIDAQRHKFYKTSENEDPTIFLQPLKDIVFADLAVNSFVYKSKNALLILEALAIIVLFLAWTNYISLSTTTLHRRLPEVGTRKVAGARNRDFMIQFLIEAAIINLFSLLLAFTLIQLIKSPAEYLFHFYVVDWNTITDQHLITLIAIPVLGILVTGFYPVLISSRKRPAELLKKLRAMQIPWWIKSMVTFQYASAVVLLIWIVVVHFQLDYILSKSTGVNQEGVLVVEAPFIRNKVDEGKLDHFINESLRFKGVYKASLSRKVMGDGNDTPFFVKRNQNGNVVGLFSSGVVDENFLDLYGVRILNGRNFQPDAPGNNRSVLISKNAAERLGFKSAEACIGARIIVTAYNIQDAEIIGVYEDYEFVPYFSGERQGGGQGSILTYKNTIASDVPLSRISFRINLRDATDVIASLEALYKPVFPQEAFRWTFLDQNISRHYAQEQIVRNQIMLFTLLAIGIACLGLLGTTTNKAIEKTKEIGIRKVLGAGLFQIAQLIISTTSRQVIIANMIGIPIAYYLVEDYMERYSDHLSFQWWHFALPVVLLVLVMFLTIASVLWKAARSNPVEALKYE